MSQSLDHLQDWVGRSRVRHDVVQAERLVGLSAALDRDDPMPEPGDPLPPCWHWMFFHEFARASELGEDGHPHKGEFFPPVPLPRRMWAGSRIAFHHAPRVGERITKRSEIVSVTTKSGRSGTLVFVVARHTIETVKGAAIVEEQDIVYLDIPAPGASRPAAKPAPETAAWRREIKPDPVLLFRYSALTFNCHRIHYDLPHCMHEGYPGLVVHGPLLATLMLDLVRRERPDETVAHFSFRALAPVFLPDAFDVAGTPNGDGSAHIWVAHKAGTLAMDATVEFA